MFFSHFGKGTTGEAAILRETKRAKATIDNDRLALFVLPYNVIEIRQIFEEADFAIKK
ncbi:MAG: hypothetical protein WBB23_06025 [Desulforhopalus sp.]